VYGIVGGVAAFVAAAKLRRTGTVMASARQQAAASCMTASATPSPTGAKRPTCMPKCLGGSAKIVENRTAVVDRWRVRTHRERADIVFGDNDCAPRERR
jgi:hypothetical protein